MTIKSPFKKLKSGSVTMEADRYIDLGELSADEEESEARMHVRVAEIYRYEDIGEITSNVYNGNLMIVDFTAIANDTLTLKRITNELRAIAKDVQGDIAGISKNMIIVAPEGVKVDRHRIKGPY